jgi:hypothetical protein
MDSNGGLTIERLALAFSGERSHNASRLRAICGLLVLPALVEAGFQENPMARILVFSELQWALSPWRQGNSEYWYGSVML